MTRYITSGIYIIDSTTDIAVAKAICIKGVNLLADAENEHNAITYARIICDLMNEYNVNE